MRSIARLLLLCLSLLGLPALAEPVSGLYQVHEAVASQAPEERDQALQRAFDTLLLRLTGSNAAAQNPAVAELRRDPQQLISKYGYENDTLVVNFDPATTEYRLREAGLALWGVNRPALLAWWLNEDAGGSNLVGDGQDSAVPLRQAAQRRGLPLRLPLADLSEQLVGTADNLTAAQPNALREASARYAADALLAVHAREEGGQWRAQWRLWLGDDQEQGSVEGADQAALADAVLLAVNELLAPRFAVAPTAAASDSLVVQIEGSTLAHYAELERLLEPFGARLQRVEGTRLTYRVKASAEQLRAQLALARLRELAPEAAAPAVDTASPEPAQPPAQAAPVQQPREPVLRFSW